MTYIITPEDIQKIRYELNDNAGPGLYILDDSTIIYYLEKNQGVISRASVDCCRAILLRLSMDSKDQICDILAIKSYKTAEQYRLALELYIKSPELNGMYSTVTAWAGGISKSDMQSNIDNLDNNAVLPPVSAICNQSQVDPKTYSTNPFLI